MDAYRQRTHTVRAVLKEVAATGRPEIPVHLEAEIGARFGGLGRFLRDIHRRWYTTFAARLDALLEAGTAQAGPVAALWLRLSAEMPEIRMLLDAHADHPALAEPERRQRELLLWATGLTVDDLRPLRVSAALKG